MTTASRPLATALWGARFAGDWLPSCYTTWGDTTDGVGIWDIAANCRTSVTMIEQHYARWLNQLLANINAGPLSRFGAEDLETPLKKPSKTTKKSAKTPDTDAPDEGPLAKKPPKTIRKPVAPKTVSG